jgi:hypothetical protein
MKKFEFVLGILAGLSLALKLLDIPGAGPLCALTFSTLATFYFYFSFAFFNEIPLRGVLKKASYQNTNKKRIAGTVWLGYGLSLILIGGLFKLQFWPGASPLLAGGLSTVLVILIGVSFFHFRNRQTFYKKLIRRIAIYGCFGFALYLTSTENLIDIYYHNHPEYAEVYKKYSKDRDNIELQRQMEQMEYEIWGMRPTTN